MIEYSWGRVEMFCDVVFWVVLLLYLGMLEKVKNVRFNGLLSMKMVLDLFIYMEVDWEWELSVCVWNYLLGFCYIWLLWLSVEDGKLVVR